MEASFFNILKYTVMFTLEEFEALPPGEVIREVITKYQHVQHVPEPLKFVVLKGKSGYDWAIYYHYADTSTEWIKQQGDKVTSKENVMALFPCEEALFKKYRF
jgi:hypothetical protein